MINDWREEANARDESQVKSGPECLLLNCRGGSYLA
jgi:hypothetical protein